MAYSQSNFRRDGSEPPTLSILIPFFGDSPTALLEKLGRDPTLQSGKVEVVLVDDGSARPELTAEVEACLKGMTCPSCLITLPRNEGRAAGRNRLIKAARGSYCLFLDSDMLPDGDGFIQTWLDLISSDPPDVVFGGFSLAQAGCSKEVALHRSMASKGDILSAALRRRTPEKYVFTSNLLVRSEILAAEGFDPNFAGWGWEDVEWGIRVSRRWAIRHIDNPASHLGLDSAETLAAKYEQSVPNFARLVSAHRGLVSAYPSYRAALMVKKFPLRGLWRPAFKALALSGHAPLGLRDFAMRLFRASLYAEVV